MSAKQLLEACAQWGRTPCALHQLHLKPFTASHASASHASHATCLSCSPPVIAAPLLVSSHCHTPPALRCRELMAQIAALAGQGRAALLARDPRQLAALMRHNFRLRRRLYGDAVVGPASLAMIEVAESVGAAAKLTGSGGAVVALCPDDAVGGGGSEENGAGQAEQLRAACQQRGLLCVRVQVGQQLHAC